MKQSEGSFHMPPHLGTGDGRPRRVGFELEFSGISLDDAVAALEKSMGGRVASRTAAEVRFQSDGLGVFHVELDWSFLKVKAAQTGADADRGGEWLELLSQAAALFVPVEVVCPPLPLTDMARLEPLLHALREAGAVGTEESLLAAYGLHINIEMPQLDAPTLHAYLKAFSLLQWWLVEAHDVDIARRVSPYVDLYPEAYMRLLCAGSEPGMDRIFEAYLEHNPSRNRALDMLPLLAHIDEKRVRRTVSDMKVRARPALHYRLPDCLIDRPEWSLSDAWNIWCVVERLAGSGDDLRALSDAFLAAERPILGVSRGDWVEFVDRWLADRALA
ncbi:amidoligase family protein [Desulfomicrobium salsuginis]